MGAPRRYYVQCDHKKPRGSARWNVRDRATGQPVLNTPYCSREGAETAARRLNDTEAATAIHAPEAQ